MSVSVSVATKQPIIANNTIAGNFWDGWFGQEPKICSDNRFNKVSKEETQLALNEFTQKWEGTPTSSKANTLLLKRDVVLKKNERATLMQDKKDISNSLARAQIALNNDDKCSALNEIDKFFIYT